MTNVLHQKIKVTIVFQKNHDAIHQKCPECHGLGDDKCTWCHGSNRRYRYIINEGSSRSSKTRSLIQLIHKCANEFKGKRISVWRDTKKDSKDTVGHDAKDIFPDLLAEIPLGQTIEFNKTEYIFSFKNSKSTIEITGADEPNKLHGYNGHIAWLNEPYDISKDIFDQLDQRTEDFILIDWNPQQAHWIDDLKKDSRTIVIHSTFRDNPFCPPEQKIKVLSYQPVKLCAAVTEKILTELEAKEYNLTENVKKLSDKQLKELARCKENERKMSASAYKWMVYGLGLKSEKPNRIFFWGEISDDEYNKIDVKRYYGVDWGTVDPWGILEAKYYDGALYLHEKNYRSENDWRENLTMTEREQVDKQEEGLVKWVFTQLGIDKKSDIICDTNRPLKIQALWDAGFDYATGAPKPPGSIIDGINLLCGMRVYYTSSSINLKYEQENYERQVDRYGIVLEEPCDKDNHCTDPARYLALFLSLMGVIKRS